MITQIDKKQVLDILSRAEKSIFTLKIQSLLDAYGDGYDFCRYYASDRVLLCKFYGDFVAAQTAGCSPDDCAEIADFIAFSGFSSVLADYRFGSCIFRWETNGRYFTYKSFLMKYSCETAAADYLEIEENPPLDEVFEILTTAFPIEHDSWYVDASHRIRHGISRVFMLDKTSTVTAAFDIMNTVFLSMVATRADRRGKGTATRLLKKIAGRYTAEGKNVLLICKDERLTFYESAGFSPVGEVFNIRQNVMNTQNKDKRKETDL